MLNSTATKSLRPNTTDKLKAYKYKNECIEALKSGKVYANAKEMLRDVKNW